MPDWGWTAVGAVAGAAFAAAGIRLWLVWYLNRNNPM